MPFQKGNKLGGNKKQNHTIQAAALKQYLIEQVIKESEPIVQALIAKGKQGDVQALREIFDRILGRSKENLDLTSGGKPVGVIGIEYVRPNQDKISPDPQTG